MTNLNRVNVLGHSAASIVAAGLGLSGELSVGQKAEPLYRALRRHHKREVLALCERYSRERGLRLAERVLP